MAKSSAVQAAMSSTAAAAPAQGAAAISKAGVANIQSVADIRDVDVVEWGNGEPVEGGAAQPPPAMARGGILDDAPAKVTPQKGEPDHADEVAAKPTSKADEPETETPAEPAKETPAEKRQRALDSLASERRARTLEQELKTTREKLAAGEKLTLGEMLKARGMDKDELLEKLLTGTDDLGLPPKLEGDAATLAALRKELDELKADNKTRAERETQRQIDDGIRTVAEHLKDVGVPLIESLAAYGDVMNIAYQDWIDGGKMGVPLDCLPKAAEKVEKALRAKHPRLAQLADAAEKAGKAAPAAVATAFTKPGITRRTTASPHGKPAPLPMDPDERDKAIRKEMGWDK